MAPASFRIAFDRLLRFTSSSKNEEAGENLGVGRAGIEARIREDYPLDPIAIARRAQVDGSRLGGLCRKGMPSVKRRLHGSLSSLERLDRTIDASLEKVKVGSPHSGARRARLHSAVPGDGFMNLAEEPQASARGAVTALGSEGGESGSN
jgi:hypothetical protein